MKIKNLLLLPLLLLPILLTPACKSAPTTNAPGTINLGGQRGISPVTFPTNVTVLGYLNGPNDSLRNTLWGVSIDGSAAFGGASWPTIINTNGLVQMKKAFANTYIGAQFVISASSTENTLDASVFNFYAVTLSANCTLTLTNMVDTCKEVVKVTDTASNYTVTWVGVDKWQGGTPPTQTTGAHSDIYTFQKINGVVYGSVSQNY